MSQYKNIGGHKYYKSLSSMPLSMAQRKADQRRKDDVCSRASPDPDHPGYYGVYVRKRK